MSDDDLIIGAAAPARQRWIHSTETLDALWVVVVSVVLVVSSIFALIDLPTVRLRTGDAPMRAFVVGLPLVAIVAATIGATRRLGGLTAAATGLLAPSVALAGSLSISLFLDDDSAFADVGVAISLAAALSGVVMFVRWFVYHPVSLWKRERRPTQAISRASTVAGLAALVSVVAADLDSDKSGVAWIAQTAVLLLVSVLVIAAGLLRTLPAAALAGGASGGQVVAVLAAKLERSDIAWNSDLVLRTGLVGLGALVACAGLAVASFRVNEFDPETEPIADSDEPWRWHLDD